MTATATAAATRPRQLLRALLVTLLAVAAFATVALPASAASAQSTAPIVYEVVLEGTASGNPFRRVGTLTLAPTITNVTSNDVNPYEACLQSGFPAGTPEVGAIWYGTSSACFPGENGQLLDLTYAVEDADGFHTSPDPNLQATMVNHWTASDDYLFAFPYGPYDGGATYQFFSDGTVAGAIELVGHGGFGGQSTYSATLVGQRIQ